MNQIQYMNPGGMPLTQDDFNFLQQSLLQVLSGLGAGFNNGQPVIISGCGTYTQAGAIWVSPGLVYLPLGNGELFYVQGGNTGTSNPNVLKIGVLDTATAPDPVSFANQVSRNIHRTRIAKVSTSGPYIFSGMLNWQAAYTQNLFNTMAATSWVSVGSGGGHPAFNTGWSGTFRYMRNAFGLVYMQIAVTAGSSASVFICTIPTGAALLPDSSLQTVIARAASGPVVTSDVLTIESDGLISIAQPPVTGSEYIVSVPAYPGVN